MEICTFICHKVEAEARVAPVPSPGKASVLPTQALGPGSPQPCVCHSWPPFPPLSLTSSPWAEHLRHD